MLKKVTDYLDKLGVEYRLLRHKAVITTEESRRVVQVDGCMACKSLYVKDKKSDDYYLVVLPFDKRADMRGLASYVNCAKFEFATEEKLYADLGVHRGSVSPFAFLNESEERSAPLLIDSEIWSAQTVKFHPCDNTATVVLSLDDLKKFLVSINKKTIVVNV
ncbi:MAG: hypothetical protein NC099_04450 [Corallococcus sp.]|nr:hypothetical protein [Bacillota bacterium]MCM1533887.1 hypothetical protein [Corallococcus sp.]